MERLKSKMEIWTKEKDLEDLKEVGQRFRHAFNSIIFLYHKAHEVVSLESNYVALKVPSFGHPTLSIEMKLHTF